MDNDAIVRYSNLCSELVQKAAALEQQIAISKSNEEKKKQAVGMIESCTNIVTGYKRTGSILKQLINEIIDYLGERSKQGNMAINAALLSARNVVPDAMSGIRMQVDGKEMWLENEDGLLVERMEGGGFRAACSLFCRKVALASNPDTMQLLILDELLAKLSSEASVTVSQYLPILAQDMQIIIIEQKKEVYAQSTCVRYNFFLAEGKTVIEKEVITCEVN